MNTPTVAAGPATPRVHWPSLEAALGIMVAGTLYPPLMADTAGQVVVQRELKSARGPDETLGWGG